MEAAGRGQAALAKHGAVAAEVSEVGAGSLGQPKQGRLCLHLGMAVPAPQLSARPGLLLRGPGHPEGTRQSVQHTGQVLKELQGLCCVCVFVCFVVFFPAQVQKQGTTSGLGLLPRPQDRCAWATC